MPRPSVRDFGKLDRPVRVESAGEIRTYAEARLEPEARVELSFVLRSQPGHAFPPWDRVFVAVEAQGAAVRAGDAGWVMLFRIWYGLVSW